jgi:aminopeptidase
VPDEYQIKLANVLVDHCVRVRDGDVVLVEAPVVAAPLVHELYRRVVQRGGHPLQRLSLDGTLETLLRYGSDAQLEWVSPVREAELEHADVRIVLGAPTNTRSMTTLDASRPALYGRAHEHLGNRSLERAAAGELRWTVSQFPTESAAQDAAMSLEQYERFVYRACLLDHDDPFASWTALGERIDRVARFLESRSELRVVAEGTDLRLGIAGRKWEGLGQLENFPDGETFTGPVEDAVEGTIRFTFPAVFQGRRVDDVFLRFEQGEVVEAHASRGEEFLRQMIAMDEGACRVGEFAFGLNEGISEHTMNTLFDEKIGGTCHLALGASYPETGGRNRSGLHWDMVCDLRSGSEVYADGELVYRDGAFLEDLLA